MLASAVFLALLDLEKYVTYLAYGLAIALNLFVLFIGLRFLFAPHAAAAGKAGGQSDPFDPSPRDR